MHPAFKNELRTILFTSNKLTSTSLFSVTQISIGSTSCVTGLEKISTNLISIIELPSRTLSNSLPSIPESIVTDKTPPGATDVGIITCPMVFPLESLKTTFVSGETEPELASSTTTTGSGSHSSLSLQPLAELGKKAELGEGDEVTSVGIISIGGRMTRDSFGVIEMDGLDVILPLELDDMLLLALVEKLVDGKIEDVGTVVLVMLDGGAEGVGTAVVVGETETATIQSSEFGPSQVSHEGWQG